MTSTCKLAHHDVVAALQSPQSSVFYGASGSYGGEILLGIEPQEEWRAEVGVEGFRPPRPGWWMGSIDFEGQARFSLYEKVARFGATPWFSDAWESPVAGVVNPFSLQMPQTEVGQSEFCAWVEEAHRWIGRGDIYQVNLSHRLAASCQGHPDSFFWKLIACSPAPGAAWLDQGNRVLISSSPETFLTFRGGILTTCPIKGTRARFLAGENEGEARRILIEDPKERAELVMITDLLRNDLGMVCSYGSISVPALCQVQEFAQVLHLVSRVQGTIADGLDIWDVLNACLPGGSVSGAPKRRALDAIASLEKRPRGAFAGVHGWVNPQGDAVFYVTIRTAVVEADVVHFHVGAGIVADSIPEKEYAETLTKARGLMLAAEEIRKRG